MKCALAILGSDNRKVRSTNLSYGPDLKTTSERSQFHGNGLGQAGVNGLAYSSVVAFPMHQVDTRNQFGEVEISRQVSLNDQTAPVVDRVNDPRVVDRVNGPHPAA